MEQAKKKGLEDKGWKIGEASEFLELSPEESILIQIKLALSLNLKERRQKLITQAELADKINSSQPHVARIARINSSTETEYSPSSALAT